ncbi:hypothetical protein [Nocardioides humi]|uniref:P/Homo B domain-containing protein n=1 Tax=Nocardioides humi TaxID=449461 RepID=A0ABN2AZC0_9ACTN|nr:hypothetical protein [Nocardioides humi]
MRRLILTTAGVIALGGLTGLSTASPAQAGVRTVTHPPAIPVASLSTSVATVNVANLPGTITDVDVVLNNVFHTFPADLDIFLQAPGSTEVVRLMSDTCGGGGTPLAGAFLTIDDQAGTSMPPAGPCPTGSYRPTNVGTGDTAPVGTTIVDTLSTFNGRDANGTWTLFVTDDAAGDVGQLAGGFTLTITTDDTPGDTTITSKPKKVSKKKKATIAFTADKANVTFECKVDKKVWKACVSPLTVKKLKPGKHRVRVRTVGASGVVESTPAVAKWKVRR